MANHTFVSTSINCHFETTRIKLKHTYLLDLALQIQQPVVDLYTLGLWKENILSVLWLSLKIKRKQIEHSS